MRPYLFALALAAAPAFAFAQGPAPSAADASTRAANAAILQSLDFADRQDFAFADKGFLATRADPVIRAADGRVVWDLTAWDFLKGAAPDTVNPSLWRQAQLLSRHGLYQVTPNIYQVRGFDISVMSVLVGETGYILVDPLTVTETAAAALALVKQNLGDKPVRAVIYTHSHADHFGGVKGVTSEADVAAGRVRIIAPEGFLEHAVGENVIAGAAMSRRAQYQFGSGLARGAQGKVSSGIGQEIPVGTLSLIAPTDTINRTGQDLTIDGVRIVFQFTPGTEAPAEMNFMVPAEKALCLAENANAGMHNVLTPRGALVRDAKAWADYLTESLRLFGGESDVVFTSHGWPRWGGPAIRDYVAAHRDAYKYLHDQSVRLMNKGLTGAEIAEVIALPPGLAAKFYNRGYYGTMSHNSKAVYQRYMGWYDANPASLHALPPEEAAKRYVAAIGGAAKVRALAAAAAKKGEHRWAAELLNRVVFANPADKSAKAMLAASFEQMAYQAESAIWRNMYLKGAQELREGVVSVGPSTVALDLIRNTPSPLLLDFLAVRLDPAKAGEADLRLALVFPERQERHLISVRNGVLVHEQGVSEAVQATVTLPRALFLQAAFQRAPLASLQPAGAVRVEGEAAVFDRLLALLDTEAGAFPIVTP